MYLIERHATKPSNPGRPTRSLVAILTELSRLQPSQIDNFYIIHTVLFYDSYDVNRDSYTR